MPLYILLMWGWLAATPTHPIYLSITDAHHNPTKKTLQIATKIFVDDLEQALYDDYKIHLNIGTKNENPRTDAYITTYLTKNLVFTHQNKILRYMYIGKETDDDAVCIYVETPKISKIRSLQIQNTILLAQHATQLNLVHCTDINNTKQTLAFRADSETQTVYFK